MAIIHVIDPSPSKQKDTAREREREREHGYYTCNRPVTK
jgi:hypothetical protein